MQFEIRCGTHHAIVEADTPGDAWRKVTTGETDGFAPLASYRSRPHGFWRYIAPENFDNLK